MKKTIIFIVLAILVVFLFKYNKGSKVRFTPDSSVPTLENTQKTSQTNEPTSEKTDKKTTNTLEKIKITSLTDNKLDTSIGYNVIRGTAPKGSNKIVINSYTLTKYRPGDKIWSYIAAKNMGTLKKGDNSYTVVAFNATGEAIGSESFKINYKPVLVPRLPSTGNSAWFAFILTFIASASYVYVKKWNTI